MYIFTIKNVILEDDKVDISLSNALARVDGVVDESRGALLVLFLAADAPAVVLVPELLAPLLVTFGPLVRVLATTHAVVVIILLKNKKNIINFQLFLL